MGDHTAIEWAGATWNPIRAIRRAKDEPASEARVGWHCEHVTEACRHCYAESMNRWRGTGLEFRRQDRDLVEIFLDEKLLDQPRGWRKSRRIFVCSMTDIAADFVTDNMIGQIFEVMRDCPQHTFLVLTKRIGRLRQWLLECEGGKHLPTWLAPWPLRNVWIGTSIHDQASADEFVPPLLYTPAEKRFLSCEPLLGPIDLRPKADLVYQHLSRWYGPQGFDETGSQPVRERMHGYFPKIDWLIAGGESGPRARPMHPDWPRSLRDQCAAAGVPFFFNQWGEWRPHHQAEAVDSDILIGGAHMARAGKKRAGRLLDGREHNGFPR